MGEGPKLKKVNGCLPKSQDHPILVISPESMVDDVYFCRRGGFATHEFSSFREPHGENCPKLPQWNITKVLDSKRAGHKYFLEKLTSSHPKDDNTKNG